MTERSDGGPGNPSIPEDQPAPREGGTSPAAKKAAKRKPRRQLIDTDRPLPPQQAAVKAALEEAGFDPSITTRYSQFLIEPTTARMDPDKMIAIKEELLRNPHPELDEAALTQLRQLSDEAQSRLPGEVVATVHDLQEFFDLSSEDYQSYAREAREADFVLVLDGPLQYGQTEPGIVNIVATSASGDTIRRYFEDDVYEDLQRDRQGLNQSPPYFAVAPLPRFTNVPHLLYSAPHLVNELGPILTGIPLFRDDPDDAVKLRDIQTRALEITKSNPLLTTIVNVYLREELEARSSTIPINPPSEQITLPATSEEAEGRDLRIAIQADAAVGMDMAELITKYGRDQSQIEILLEPHPEDFIPGEGRTRHTWSPTERAALLRAIAIDSTPTESRPALTFNELAARYGLGRSTLAKLRQEAGVGSTHGPQVTPEERQRIIQDARGGMTTKQLVEQYGRSRSTISLILFSVGLTQERGQSQTVLNIWQADQQIPYTELKRRALQAGLTPTQFWDAVGHLSSEAGGSYPIPRAGQQPTEE